MARLLVVDRLAPDPSAIEEAVCVLRAGGLVGFPTETVYGLGARALDPVALARVFAAKGRPANHPLIAHVLGEAQAVELSSSWPAGAAELARAFWPGPLTLVVGRGPHVPAAIAGGGDSIAVRVPSHPVARALLAAFGEPIAAPSANRYQGLSPTTAHHVMKELGEVVDLVLDAGPCDDGIESTVVDARDRPLRVLRPGVVGIAALRAVTRDVDPRTLPAPAGTPRLSPGLDARHYAPRARLLLAASWEEAVRLADEVAAGGERAGIVTHEAHDAAHTGEAAVIHQLPDDAAGYARALYATLHRLDDDGVDAIVVQCVSGDETWCAVADRLGRASG